MANVATKVAATQNRLVYSIAGDGTVAGPTIANATLLADMVAGSPLRDLWNATYANQAAMRAALMANEGRILITMLTTVADTTAQVNQASVDVDTDAVTATKAEINVTMSDTTGTLMYLSIEHIHSIPL